MKIVYRREDTEREDTEPRALPIPAYQGPALSARGHMCVPKADKIVAASFKDTTCSDLHGTNSVLDSLGTCRQIGECA